MLSRAPTATTGAPVAVRPTTAEDGERRDGLRRARTFFFATVPLLVELLGFAGRTAEESARSAPFMRRRLAREADYSGNGLTQYT